MGLLEVGDAERATFAVERIGAAFLILGLLEEREHVVPAPALIAHLAPELKVLPLAADVDEAIDGTRSAENAPARPGDLPAFKLRFGLGLIAPIELFVENRPIIADRNMQPGIGNRGRRPPTKGRGSRDLR